MFHQNINRFSGKLLDLELFTETEDIDVICLTETWLKNDMMKFNVNNYVVASVFNRGSAAGGGSIILVKKGLVCKERKDLSSLSVERVCEVASAEMDRYIFISVYRPPSCSLISYINVMEDVLRKASKSNKSIVVCGDFNVDILSKSVETDQLTSLFGSFHLDCLFNVPTRVTPTSATCIDNIWLNCPHLDSRIINGVRSDHKAQIVRLPLEKKHSDRVIEIRPLSKGRLDRLKSNLLLSLPPAEDLPVDPNELFKELLDTVCREFNMTCSKKQIKIKNKMSFSDWATTGIRKSRDTLYNLYDRRSYTTDERFHQYVRDYSKLFKSVCVKAKAAYLKNKINSSSNKAQAVWKIINTETGKKTKGESIVSLKVNNTLVTDKKKVADEFNNFFSKIPLETTRGLASSCTLAETILRQYVNIGDWSVFQFRYITPFDIFKSFKMLKIKNTEDLWGVSVKVLESIIEVVAPSLAVIFNNCIDKGLFPNLMKYSKVVPIFKKGDKDNPSDYRPVSILPAFSKIFEKIMLTQLISHFNHNSILHSQQFGFTKSRSTTDAGISLIKFILQAWEGSQDAIGVFCDLSKAFDCVDHSTLICKLNFYGIQGRALELIKSYLSERNQKVEINGVLSSESKVEVGVPQGSILGPFLFLVYVNDLPHMVSQRSGIVMFADDTSLLFKVNRKDTELVEPNATLSMISEWFAANNLMLNPDKTKCVKFSLASSSNHNTVSNIELNGQTIEFVRSTLFLGITLDSKLQWGLHIASIVGRLSSAVFAIGKMRQLTNVATARLVYFAYFNSILTYGLILWGSAADINTVFILQKRAVRAIYNLSSRHSLREMFKEIDILTLPSLYVFEVIMYVRRNLHNFPTNSDKPKTTRNTGKLKVTSHRLVKSKNSFLGNCVRFYNKIPKCITDLTDSRFKSMVKRTLMSKAYYKVNEYIIDRDAWH